MNNSLSARRVGRRRQIARASLREAETILIRDGNPIIPLFFYVGFN